MLTKLNGDPAATQSVGNFTCDVRAGKGIKNNVSWFSAKPNEKIRQPQRKSGGMDRQADCVTLLEVLTIRIVIPEFKQVTGN